MISDFVEYIGKNGERYKFSSVQETDTSFFLNPLSITERGRLQRAFFNLELYSRLFHSEPNQASEFNAIEQSCLFLSRMPSWQITEIACIHEYLLDRLVYIFDKVEDRFVAFDFVNGASSDCSTAEYASESMSESESESEGESESESTSSNSSEAGNYDDYSIPTELQGWDRFEGGDRFFAQHTKRSDHKHYMEYMTSLGLEWFHNLFLADDANRSQIVVTSGQFGGDFLAKSLAARPRDYMVLEKVESDGNDEVPYGHPLKFLGDRLDTPNLAWLWSFDFRQSTANSAIASRPQNSFLRSWGYVFWDATRIRSFQILDQRYVKSDNRQS
ncbi:hypothetical protein MMC11_001007 [Xylographa trunciseda]|nr:hypothetical protein [Xylographa trunciseda]